MPMKSRSSDRIANIYIYIYTNSTIWLNTLQWKWMIHTHSSVIWFRVADYVNRASLCWCVCMCLCVRACLRGLDRWTMKRKKEPQRFVIIEQLCKHFKHDIIDKTKLFYENTPKPMNVCIAIFILNSYTYYIHVSAICGWWTGRRPSEFSISCAICKSFNYNFWYHVHQPHIVLKCKEKKNTQKYQTTIQWEKENSVAMLSFHHFFFFGKHLQRAALVDWGRICTLCTHVSVWFSYFSVALKWHWGWDNTAIYS